MAATKEVEEVEAAVAAAQAADKKLKSLSTDDNTMIDIQSTLAEEEALEAALEAFVEAEIKEERLAEKKQDVVEASTAKAPAKEEREKESGSSFFFKKANIAPLPSIAAAAEKSGLTAAYKYMRRIPSEVNHMMEDIPSAEHSLEEEGLELSLERLQSMGKFVFGMGSAQVVLSTALSAAAVMAISKLSAPGAIIVGGGLAMSSTAVALQVLQDRGRQLDLPVYFGDAGSPAVLHSIGAGRAKCAVITLDTPGANYRVVWSMNKNYPKVKTYVRARDVEHGLNLEKAGATAVVPETLEPSLQLAAAVLSQMDLPDEEVVTAIDSFRRAHVRELSELAEGGGFSLGYGMPSIRAEAPSNPPPAPLDSGAVGDQSDGGGSGGVQVDNVFVLPGIPRLFQSMLEANQELFTGTGFTTQTWWTQWGEGDLADALTQVAEKYSGVVQIGSYPRTKSDHTYVTKLVFEGRDADAVRAAVEEASETIELHRPEG
eukprot:jgi/Pico_ML_1/52074/g2840.t1